MKTFKIMSIFGTRPEAIKMAPVIQALEAEPGLESLVTVTAQHRQMLDQVLEMFGITPLDDLNIMQANQTLFDISRRALEGLEQVLENRKPDLVLVQGDTSTAFIAALAAFYHKIPVGHIEAGLRTHNKYDPFPEEMNRRLITVLGDLHFAPTYLAEENLRSNGIWANVFRTGNTVIDALFYILKQTRFHLPPELEALFPSGRRVLLVETHRRENLGKPMHNICLALKQLALEFPDVDIVFSVHRNPKVREVVHGVLEGLPQAHLLEPLDYHELVHMMQKAFLVLTDSGGIQEEAPSLGKPVLVLRRTTERPEGIEAGTAKLAGVEQEGVYREAHKLLTDASEYQRMAKAVNPYGDGQAAARTVAAIKYFLGLTQDKPGEYLK